MAPPCFCAYNRTMDIKTPRNMHLSAFYRRSFAFRTVRDRLPIIITQTIDELSRNKETIIEQYGEGADQDIKVFTGKLAKLKYEIQTNKTLRAIKSNSPDAAIYNDYIKDIDGQEGKPTPYHAIWLLIECYMYRKMKEALEDTKILKEFDPFHFKKEEAFQSSLPQIRELAPVLREIIDNRESEEEFARLLKFNLWGNKADLSLSNGAVIAPKECEDITKWDDKILCDDTHQIWETLHSEGDVVDIVMDNAGLEAFTDLCLADYIIKKGLAKRVNLHVKKIPWFVSDTMVNDIKWLLDQLSKSYEDLNLTYFGETWTKHFEEQTFVIQESDFWVLPHIYIRMPFLDPGLYEDLSKSKLIIFKGDLNYRKLFQEKAWDPITPVEEAVGYFGPTSLCILRTVKADIICGLQPGVAEACEKDYEYWMESGEYGVIQYSGRIVSLEEAIAAASPGGIEAWTCKCH